jgi:hypothetical protein
MKMPPHRRSFTLGLLVAWSLLMVGVVTIWYQGNAQAQVLANDTARQARALQEGVYTTEPQESFATKLRAESGRSCGGWSVLSLSATYRSSVDGCRATRMALREAQAQLVAAHSVWLYHRQLPDLGVLFAPMAAADTLARLQAVDKLRVDMGKLVPPAELATSQQKVVEKLDGASAALIALQKATETTDQSAVDAARIGAERAFEDAAQSLSDLRSAMRRIEQDCSACRP